MLETKYMKTNKNTKKSYVPLGERYKDEEGKPVSRQMAVYMRKTDYRPKVKYDESLKNQQNLQFIYQFLKRTKNLHFFDDKMALSQAYAYSYANKKIDISDYIYEKFETAFKQGLAAEKKRLALIIETEKSKKSEFEKNLDIFLSEYAGNHNLMIKNQAEAREMLSVIHQTAKLSRLFKGMKDFINPYRLAAIARNENLPITAQFMLEAFLAYEWVLKSVVGQCEQRIQEAQAESSKIFAGGESFTRILPLFEKKEQAAPL